MAFEVGEGRKEEGGGSVERESFGSGKYLPKVPYLGSDQRI